MKSTSMNASLPHARMVGRARRRRRYSTTTSARALLDSLELRVKVTCVTTTLVCLEGVASRSMVKSPASVCLDTRGTTVLMKQTNVPAILVSMVGIVLMMSIPSVAYAIQISLARIVQLIETCVARNLAITVLRVQTMTMHTYVTVRMVIQVRFVMLIFKNASATLAGMVRIAQMKLTAMCATVSEDMTVPTVKY